jgi:LPS export ABC transporter protein LptC
MSRQVWIIILLVVVAFTGCGKDQTASTDQGGLTDSTLRPDSEVSGARIYLYDRGRVITEIVAEKIVTFESIDSTMGYKLDIDVYDSTGAATANIVGDSGIIREATGNLSLYGNVVVITADSSKLETEYLYWDSEVDSIKTNAFVRLTKGEDVITGWGLQADQRLHSTKILSRVSGTITDPKKF